jgi:hypothetical protein
MNGKITVVRFKGSEITEEDFNADRVLNIDFTGDDGQAVSVTINQGSVIVSANGGRLAVLPIAANSVRVKCENL